MANPISTYYLNDHFIYPLEISESRVNIIAAINIVKTTIGLVELFSAAVYLYLNLNSLSAKPYSEEILIWIFVSAVFFAIQFVLSLLLWKGQKQKNVKQIRLWINGTFFLLITGTALMFINMFTFMFIHKIIGFFFLYMISIIWMGCELNQIYELQKSLAMEVESNNENSS